MGTRTTSRSGSMGGNPLDMDCDLVYFPNVSTPVALLATPSRPTMFFCQWAKADQPRNLPCAEWRTFASLIVSGLYSDMRASLKPEASKYDRTYQVADWSKSSRTKQNTLFTCNPQDPHPLRTFTLDRVSLDRTCVIMSSIKTKIKFT